jgi:hypothetical protein
MKFCVAYIEKMIQGNTSSFTNITMGIIGSFPVGEAAGA